MNALNRNADRALPIEDSQQRLARVAGLLYLVVAVFGMFAPTVLQSVVVSGDAAATAQNIVTSRWLFGSSLVGWIVIVVADVAVAVTFYLLLEPVSRALSLVAAAFRLVYGAMLAAILVNLYNAFLLLTSAQRGAGLDAHQSSTIAMSSLDTFSAGFLVAIVFFGVHLVALGFLLVRSGYVPRVLAILVVAAGASYMLDSLVKIFVPDYDGLIRVVLLAPAVVGELGLTAWLLVKGVNVGRAADTSTSATARTASAASYITA